MWKLGRHGGGPSLSQRKRPLRGLRNELTEHGLCSGESTRSSNKSGNRQVSGSYSGRVFEQRRTISARFASRKWFATPGRHPIIVRVVRTRLIGSFPPGRGLGRWVGLLGGLVVACAILALIGWNVVRLAEGQVSVSELACIDVTDPCNYSSYSVKNDAALPVVLRECMHHCGRGDRRLDPVSIDVARTTSNDAVTALVGSRAWWEVRSSSNHLLGCLVLDGHQHKHDGDVVVVSSVQPCRAHASSTPARAAQTND